MSARPPVLAADAAMMRLGMEAKGRVDGTRKDGERRRAGATAKARSKGKVQSKAAVVEVTRRVEGGRGRRMYTRSKGCDGGVVLRVGRFQEKERVDNTRTDAQAHATLQL
jgi:hypothetical protein